MFWGLIMEPNKRYTQTVEKSFHVSMASLDAVTADNAIVQVMLCYDERNYLLCSLKKDLAWQVPLDLNFQEGTKIAFTSNGRGHVHLTGYLIPEEEDDLDLDEMEDEEEEEDEEEVPQLVGKQPKRKANESPKENKKIKRLKALLEQKESSDEEDDDVEKDDEEEEESLEVEGEAEDDSDEADDDEDEEEEDDSEEEEEEEVEVKPQQKKNKQQQQQQKQNAKQEKQKMVNGKDSKQEPQKQQKKNKAEQQQQQQNNAQVQKKKVVEGGVQVEDLKVGNGAPAKSGKFISVYYVGRLKNGKKFDATQNGEGFKFRLGKGEVIKGWDVGIAGMKVGGKRRITIPPPFAYGAKGSPPTIPGNSTLVFEVELKNVH